MNRSLGTSQIRLSDNDEDEYKGSSLFEIIYFLEIWSLS